jgi:AcrR family transcriptional regulator
MNNPELTDADKAGEPAASLRDRILATASALFYREGVHAVGVDLVVKESGIAKTSLYRHFGSKDSLVTAFLDQEDQDFWSQWDRIADCYEDDPRGELEALLHWMDVRLRRPGYRGCPQLNVAAELPDPAHPARRVAAAHKEKMRRRLSSIAERLQLNDPEKVGSQLALAFDGAFISAPFGQGEQLAETLRQTVKAIVESARA